MLVSQWQRVLQFILSVVPLHVSALKLYSLVSNAVLQSMNTPLVYCNAAAYLSITLSKGPVTRVPHVQRMRNEWRLTIKKRTTMTKEKITQTNNAHYLMTGVHSRDQMGVKRISTDAKKGHSFLPTQAYAALVWQGLYAAQRNALHLTFTFLLPQCSSWRRDGIVRPLQL